MWVIAAKSEYPRTSIPETPHSREVIRPDHLTSQRLILLAGLTASGTDRLAWRRTCQPQGMARSCGIASSLLNQAPTEAMASA